MFLQNAAVPSTTSPSTTRRLLPRITTKKTENSSTVMLVCETRNSKAPFIPTSTSATIINVPPDPDSQLGHISDRKVTAPVTPTKTDSLSKDHSSSPLAKTKSPVASKREIRIAIEGDVYPKKAIKLPNSLSIYYRNAPIKKLRHPLEENIFSSLFITLFAITVALVIGTPLLCGVGLIVVVAVGFRYSIAVLNGIVSYTRFICSNRQHPSSRSQPPQIFPRDRLAFANDVRWLGPKKRSRCQSVIHTLLVFEGSIDLTTFRHLIQTRVLRAETPEGELLYPRLLEKLVSVSAGYLWDLDVTFDIQNHIFSGPTHFTSEIQLQQYLGRLMTQSLPMSKPLWEIRLVPSYYGGGKDTMAILRVHQCLADGMSLIRILSHALADHQQMHVPQRPHFAGMSFGFNVLRSLIVGPVTIFLWWFGTFRDHNLFSIPLPKLKRRGKRKGWRFWRNCRRDPEEKSEDDEIDENTLSFTSSIGSRSSYSSASSIHSSVSSSSSSAKRNSQQQPSSSPSGGENPEPPHNLEASSDKSGKGARLGFLTRNAKKYKKRCKKLKKQGRKGRRKRRQGHTKNKRKFGKRRLQKSSSLSNSSASISSSYSRGTASSQPSRRWRAPSWNVVWSAPLSLPKLARVKQIMRSSVNDVLLSAAAGSIRTYLQEQGIPYPDDVQVVIPVDLRNDVASPKVSPRLGCKVASVLTSIPSGIESAIPRLWATRHRLDELKASADSVVAYGATTILMNIFPHWVAIPILESVSNKASFQFSNLPGPTFTTVIGGYPVKGIYPIYPPPGTLRAAISVFTYADQVHITVVSHKSLVDAGPKILHGITEQVEQLSRQLSQRRVPGESRRSTRNFHQVNNAEITKPPTRQIHFKLQAVQEELAQINSRLEAHGIILSDQEYSGFISVPPVPSSSAGYGYYHQRHPEEETDELPPSSELTPAGQVELQNRLKSLKNEFAELIGELRRRSSIVEGIAMSFEDEENEEEYRKPRNRALSVVSMTRRSSIFSSRSNTAPESPVYSSDEDLPSSPVDVRVQQPASSGGTPSYPNIRHSSSPMRTTAV